MEDAIRIFHLVFVDNIFILLLFACSWILVYWFLMLLEFLIAKVYMELRIYLGVRIRRRLYGVPKFKKAVLSDDERRASSSEASIRAIGRYMSAIDRELSRPLGPGLLLRRYRYDRDAKAIYSRVMKLLEADEALLNVLSRDPVNVARGVLKTAGGSVVTRPEALRILLHAAIFGPAESRDISLYNIKMFARSPEDLENLMEIRNVASYWKWSVRIRGNVDEIIRQITEARAEPCG